jgi:hypothetical protein
MKIKTHRDIYNCIIALQTESSSNRKKEILLNWFNDSPEIQNYMETFLDYTYNEVAWTYNIKQLPEIDTQLINTDRKGSIIDLFELALFLQCGTGGEEEKEEINKFLLNADYELQYLLSLLIERSINAGVEKKTISDCFPNLAHLISPYMRCEKEPLLDKRINYPAIAQVKADGLFMNVFTGDYSIKKDPRFITRYGNIAQIEGGLNKVISMLTREVPNFINKVLMGELLIKIDGVILPREVGNGRINSYIKRFNTLKTLEKKLAKAKTQKAKDKILLEKEERLAEWEQTENNLIFKYWDMIEEEEFYKRKSNSEYIKRVEKLNIYMYLAFQQMDNEERSRILPIESKIVKNKKEVYEFFAEVLKLGEEGLVVKNTDLDWCHDVNRNGIIKLKDFKECDLKIITYIPGEDNYTGGIGALICESIDGLVKVNPSSGLTMAQRGLERVDLKDSSKGWKPIEGFDLNQYNDKIAALKFNDLMEPDEDGIYSLFIPIIMEIREKFDKQEADNLQKIKEQ